MTPNSSSPSAHLSDEQSLVVGRDRPPGVDVDSFCGSVHVEWDHGAAMTPLGQLPFFIHFLKTSGLLDALIADCPLRYVSPNAPSKRDVLGTTMLSVLAGHKRYAHIAALRFDVVLAELLGMKKVVSEDAIRRAFKAIDEAEGAAWLRGHLAFCVEPLLAEPWILDVDTTIKPLYGHQEGATLSYNSKRPGHPSHCFPHLFDGLDAFGSRCQRQLPATSTHPNTARRASGGSSTDCRATCGRRCCVAIVASATTGVMREAEARGLPYLFKLLVTKERQAHGREAGERAPMGGRRSRLRGQEERGSVDWLEPARRTIVMRRRVKGAVGLSQDDGNGAAQLSFAEIGEAKEVCEYSVLTTSLDEQTETFGHSIAIAPREKTSSMR